MLLTGVSQFERMLTIFEVLAISLLQDAIWQGVILVVEQRIFSQEKISPEQGDFALLGRYIFLCCFPVFFPKLHRRDAELLFEHILKIALTGIAEVGADLGEALVAISQ